MSSVETNVFEAAPSLVGRLHFCPQCGYDLSHAASDRCPECGLDIGDEEAVLRWAVPWQTSGPGWRRWLRTMWWARSSKRLRMASGFDLDAGAALRYRRWTWLLLWLSLLPWCWAASYGLSQLLNQSPPMLLGPTGMATWEVTLWSEFVMPWLAGAESLPVLAAATAWWSALLLGVPAVCVKWLAPRGEPALQAKATAGILTRYLGGSVAAVIWVLPLLALLAIFVITVALPWAADLPYRTDEVWESMAVVGPFVPIVIVLMTAVSCAKALLLLRGWMSLISFAIGVVLAILASLVALGLLPWGVGMVRIIWASWPG